MTSSLGRLVSKEALLEAVWPETAVSEAVLTVAIRRLRRVLGDRARTPQFIETVHSRGYRFIAPVQEQSHDPPVDGTSTTLPVQSMPPPPSTAGREEPPPPVSLPPPSGECDGLSEACRSPSLAGEYKQVTVLCGGVADALALAGHLGPEAMHRCMQTVFTVVQQVMHRYAGSLIEWSGEGFVALFGAPVAQEDHALRAVLAALALHERWCTSASGLRQMPREPIALCLGLDTGRVVVDHFGGDPQRLYTAAGETTHLALRLRQRAAPGTILLSAATQRLVQEHVWVEPQGEVQVSAARAPVPAYSVGGLPANGPASSVMARGRAVPSWDGHENWPCCRSASTR
jgi:class 3 adenylate cyclase